MTAPTDATGAMERAAQLAAAASRRDKLAREATNPTERNGQALMAESNRYCAARILARVAREGGSDG